MIPNFVDDRRRCAHRPRALRIRPSTPVYALPRLELSSAKRIEDVIHTFARLQQTAGRPVRLLLIGEGPSAPSEDLVRRPVYQTPWSLSASSRRAQRGLCAQRRLPVAQPERSRLASPPWKLKAAAYPS